MRTYKLSKHKQSKHKQSKHKQSKHKLSKHKRSHTKRKRHTKRTMGRKTRKFSKRGGGKCEDLYNQCKKEMPPSLPPRKHRSPKKEDIYEAYEADKGTPYENASLGSSNSKKQKKPTVVGRPYNLAGTNYTEVDV